MTNKIKLIPLPILLFMGTLAVGLTISANHQQFMGIFNESFTGSLGYFCLILLPSFLMAASLSNLNLPRLGLFSKILAPFAGAGMICPDTAYAAMSPMAGDQKKSLVLGTYAGFKLLPPAGPLIIAASLGINDPALLLKGFILLIPVWIAGELFLSFFSQPVLETDASDSGKNYTVFLPLLATALLILIGLLFKDDQVPVLIKFVFHPAGALLVGAFWAWLLVPADRKKDCFDTALSNTGRLVLLIGLSTAFGKTLALAFPITQLFKTVSPEYIVLTLFFCAALFKSVQGSSMATFAALAPVTAPIIAAGSISPALAVYSIALGSFVAVLPNDSFYWLSREDAYQRENDGRATMMIASGSIIQSIVGLSFLILFNALGLI